MKLYLDLIFLINIWFDFLLLMTVSILLKRNISIKRIILGSVFGGLTIFILFFKLNSVLLNLYKFLISVFMILITFSYKDFKYMISNLAYFYLISIILGGGLYLLSDCLVSSNGLLLYRNNFSINYLVLIIASPIIVIFYVKQSLRLKDNFANYHKVDIFYKKKLYHLNGYLDTGNNLIDPYKRRKVILVNLNLKYDLNEVIYTPYESLNNQGVVKCLKPDKLYVDKKEFKNYLIGLATDKFKIDGVDCILHNSMKGDLK